MFLPARSNSEDLLQQLEKLWGSHLEFLNRQQLLSLRALLSVQEAGEELSGDLISDSLLHTFHGMSFLVNLARLDEDILLLLDSLDYCLPAVMSAVQNARDSCSLHRLCVGRPFRLNPPDHLPQAGTGTPL